MMDDVTDASYKSCLADEKAEYMTPAPTHNKSSHPFHRNSKTPPKRHEHKKNDDYIESDEDEVPAFVKARDQMRKQNRSAMKKLLLVTFLSAVFMSVEIIGGLMANSIAIISDAAHLASDVIGLAISVCALAIA